VISIGTVDGQGPGVDGAGRWPTEYDCRNELRYHMAEDGYSRAHRVNDPYGRGGAAARPSSPNHDDDPLSELARLIGQGDAAHWRAASAPANSNHDGYHNSGAHPNDQHYEQQHYDDPHYDARGYDAQNYAGQGYAGQGYAGQGYTDQGYADSHFQNNAYQHDGYQGGYEQPAFQQSGYQAPFYGNDRGARLDHHDDYHHDDHHDHDVYEDARPARRGGFLAVVAVFSLAVIGTAGAFTYRNLFAGSGPKQVPVVLADATPVKVVPTNTADNSSKPADLPDLRQVERVTPREEQPLNLPVLSPASPPVAFPSPAPPPVTQSAQPGEPKRVRTVIITPSTAPDAIGQPGASRAPRNAKPAAAPATEPSGDAPLSLSPEGAEPPPPRGIKLATRSSTVIAPSVAGTQSPASAAAGSFTVQLSAQKSEEDAQSTFRALQAKYPNLLDGRQPIIRKKDLPSGVFYGVQVGPFAHDEAVQFCEDMKSAHGECWLQKN
jgi:hypothetical protein